MALLKEASEMFTETGCVPGIDGEEVPAETIVPDVKEYISETIDDPEAIYDPKIWDASGFALVLSWLAQKWHQRCHKLALRGSKNPQQYLTNEQQKACLDTAAAELVREITQGPLALPASSMRSSIFSGITLLPLPLAECARITTGVYAAVLEISTTWLQSSERSHE